jgi:BRCT domain type II-containing protein
MREFKISLVGTLKTDQLEEKLVEAGAKVVSRVLPPEKGRTSVVVVGEAAPPTKAVLDRAKEWKVAI